MRWYFCGQQGLHQSLACVKQLIGTLVNKDSTSTEISSHRNLSTTKDFTGRLFFKKMPSCARAFFKNI